MLAIQTTVQGSPRKVQTKYGERAVMDVLIDGETKALWGPADDMRILGRRRGERVVVGQEKNGKLHLINTNSDGLTQPTYSEPTTTINTTAVAVATKPVVKETKPMYQEKNVTPNVAADLLIKRYAEIMARCRQEVKATMGINDEELIQKYATSLFIQITKQLEQF